MGYVSFMELTDCTELLSNEITVILPKKGHFDNSAMARFANELGLCDRMPAISAGTQPQHPGIVEKRAAFVESFPLLRIGTLQQPLQERLEPGTFRLVDS